jgi:hypothetical protein
MKLEQVYHGKLDEYQAGSLGSYLLMDECTQQNLTLVGGHWLFFKHA